MTTPEVITTKSRSDGAKKMWERRRAKETTEVAMQQPIKAWVYHAEWFTLCSIVVGLFLFVHHEYVHTNERLDRHMEAINRRCDELHKEFYSLLKEMKE